MSCPAKSRAMCRRLFHGFLVAWLSIMLPAGVVFARSLEQAVQAGDMAEVKRQLADSPSSLEPAGENIRTPLHIAAAAGRDEIVTLLLDKGADIQRRNWGRNALYYAVENDKASTAALLLARGAKVDDVLVRGRQVIHLAAARASERTLDALVRAGADVNARSQDNHTPLHDAAMHPARTAAVKWLIKHHANPNVQDDRGYTPLMLAVMRGWPSAKWLIEAGADIHARTDHGTTALHVAAAWDTADAVAGLLAAGAEPDALASDQGTPLDRAARRGGARIGRLLLDKGARPDARTASNWTPIHRAAAAGGAELITLLLDRGVKVDAPGPDGKTPLYLAVECDQPQAAAVLLKHKADPSLSPDEDKVSSLHRAVDRASVPMVTMLLEHGASPDEPDRWGRTPLHHAARRGNDALARLLVEKGAEVNRPDAQGFTPLDMARFGRHESTTELLVGLGADVATARTSQARRVSVDGRSAVQYLLAARKPNGAFGPHDNGYTDLAWSYPAVAALRLLGQEMADPARCLAAGRDKVYSFDIGPKYWTLHMRARYHRLLGGDMRQADRITRSQWELAYMPVDQMQKLDNARGVDDNLNNPRLAFHNISALWYLLDVIRTLVGQAVNVEQLTEFIARRQAESGAWVEDFDPEVGIGAALPHVVFTSHAVQSLKALGQPIPRRNQVIQWLQSCQDESGGFRRAPGPASADNQPDIWYTFEALAALSALDAAPRDAIACDAWVDSLQNHDGGFGDQPGWVSRLYSTYYAVHALALLHEGDALGRIRAKQVQVPVAEPIPDGMYRIFQAQHQTPPGGPEMVDAIAQMRLDFIGITDGSLLAGARAYLVEAGLPGPHMHAVLEDQGHRVRYLGENAGHHMADYLIPALDTLNPDRRRAWQETLARIRPLARQGLPWAEYRDKVITPLTDLGSLYMIEQEWDMAFSYMAYQDGQRLRRGYNVVHVAHFNGPDVVRRSPHRERAIGRVAPIADGDSHGDVESWRPQLNAYRTLYLARTAALDDYVDAVLNGRACTVIRDPSVPGGLTWYGPPAVVEHVKRHIDQWRWWN